MVRFLNVVWFVEGGCFFFLFAFLRWPVLTDGKTEFSLSPSKSTTCPRELMPEASEKRAREAGVRLEALSPLRLTIAPCGGAGLPHGQGGHAYYVPWPTQRSALNHAY